MPLYGLANETYRFDGKDLSVKNASRHLMLEEQKSLAKFSPEE
jgi:hypothetical protein